MGDSLKFGTSGLRGLATELIGAPSARYASAFVAYLKAKGAISDGSVILVGEDLRESSAAIARSVVSAIAAAGLRAVHCGQLPTPALALEAQRLGVPAIMVTGSHIPADRNGLKFYAACGEIDKSDEAGILSALEGVGGIAEAAGAAEASQEAEQRYRARYAGVLPASALKDWRIGVYQHSSVARDLLVAVLEGFGAEVVPLGRSSAFVPVDTEAVSAELQAQAREWVRGLQLDALVSTDGDADRPLIADNSGAIIRGDVIGILAALQLGADAVVTPVTSNSSIEGMGRFAAVLRTRVGSPFVIEGIAATRRAGRTAIVGFEANGGVLLGSDVKVGEATLTALPTRDAFLPILAVLARARESGQSLAELVATLPPRWKSVV